MAKAIIETESVQAMFKRTRMLARRADAGERLPQANFHLTFANAGQLLTELTPARLRLLESLKTAGPVTIYALAKRLKRNYSNVHQDVMRLTEHGLITKDKAGHVFIPWEEIQIRLTLKTAA